MADASGLYWRNGRAYHRVSAVAALKFPFQKTQNTVAMAKGTALHEEICRFYHGQQLTGNPDFHMFEKFVADHPHYVSLMSERTIFSDIYGIAGTIDSLFYDAENGEYILVDWKRSRALFSKSAIRYQIQLSLYRDLLFEDLKTQIDRMVLVLMHPDNDGYRIVEVPYEDQRVLVEEFNAANPPIPTLN